jgi:hypothetical protein
MHSLSLSSSQTLLIAIFYNFKFLENSIAQNNYPESNQTNNLCKSSNETRNLFCRFTSIKKPTQNEK